MKRPETGLTIVVAFILIVAFPVHADDLSNEVDLSLAWRSDDLHFVLPFEAPLPGGSELNWENLESLFTRAEFSLPLGDRWRAHLNAGYGSFSAGRVTDRDWLNAFGTFSYTEHDADKGGVTEVGLDFSRHVSFLGMGFRFSAGYAFNRLDLHVLEKGSRDIIPGGRTFRGLDTTYDAQTHQLVLGFATDRYQRPRREMSLSFDYSTRLGLGYYSADANWNLRPDFAHPVSFTQEGIPFSAAFGFNPTFALRGGHELGLRIESGGYSVLAPQETLYFSDGQIARGTMDEISTAYASVGLFYRLRF